MGETLSSDLPYDPRLFSVGPAFGPSAPDANDESQQHHHADSMLGFPPSTPWNTWAVAGRPTMNAASTAVFPPHSHHVQQLSMMPAMPGMTDFEPLVTTTYDNTHHSVSSTRGTPVSPSQESSSSAVSPSDFQPQMRHRSSQPLDIRFEPPGSSSSKATRSPAESQVMAEQRLGERKNSSATDWAVPVSVTTAGGAIHLSTEALDDASRDLPHTSAARRKRSVVAADASSRPETPLTSIPESHGHETRRQQPQRAMSLPKNSSSSSSNNNSHSRPPSAKREHTISHPHRDEPPAVIINNTNNSGTNMVAASQRLRNRAAATKCRMKSKVAIAQLEATERVLSDQHSQLSATVTGLRDEVLTLKNEILLHGNCDCDLINHYLRNAARNLGGGARGGPVPTTAAPPPLGQDQDRGGQHLGHGSSGWSSTTSPTPPGP